MKLNDEFYFATAKQIYRILCFPSGEETLTLLDRLNAAHSDFNIDSLWWLVMSSGRRICLIFHGQLLSTLDQLDTAQTGDLRHHRGLRIDRGDLVLRRRRNTQRLATNRSSRCRFRTTSTSRNWEWIAVIATALWKWRRTRMCRTPRPA